MKQRARKRVQDGLSLRARWAWMAKKRSRDGRRIRVQWNIRAKWPEFRSMHRRLTFAGTMCTATYVRDMPSMMTKGR